MGQAFSKRLQEIRNRKKLVVEVTTGDKAGAGTDCYVWIILEDVTGRKSDKIYLDHTFSNDLERGTTDVFPQSNLEDFNDINVIELGREDTLFIDRWFLDRITIRNKGKVFVFPIQRWIKSQKVYRVALYDCCLPNNSLDVDRRKEELQEKRKVYAYKQVIPYGPAQIESLPEDEQFHEDYASDLTKRGIRLRVGYFFTKLFTGRICNLDDLQNLFSISSAFPEPISCRYWKEDEWFGLERVQGINPVLITLCKEIPDNLGITNDMAEPILHISLEEAIEQNRLFIIDLKILKGNKHNENRALVAPICLLYKDTNDQLMPLAIQLDQDKAEDNPVFLPTDDHYTWLLAKMWFNMADAQYHQCITHLGITHLLMEGVCIAANRNLSPSHPVFRLLAPHFLHVLAINVKAGEFLIQPGTVLNETSTIGAEGMHQLMTKVHDELTFEGSAHIKNDMKARGVMDKEVLSYYPYRDDAVAIYDIIEEYVTAIVMYYYDTEQKLLEDEELQAWRKELSDDKDSNKGAGLRGVPGNDEEGFSTREQLITTVSIIIHTCSVKHSAANAPQYYTYALSPNYPLTLEGHPPTNKDERTEQDIIDVLPDKSVMLTTMRVGKLLAQQATNMLGDFEVVYLYEDVCVDARKRFKKRLEELGASIRSRNARLKHPYIYLDPTKSVVNSISI